MTDLRKAAQEALDAWDDPMKDLKDLCVAMDALRTALAQQQAEPVATFQDGVLEGQLREREYWVKQQAEPICPECKAAVLYECVACSSNNYPPKQQAEPVAWMDKHGNIDHGLDAILEPEGWKPLYTIPPAAQRQWVGLTDEDFLEACQIAERGNYLLALQRIQIKLKERNT